MRGYRERFPRMELDLNSNEGVIDLLERRTDVAIRIGRLKDSTLHSRLTGNSRLRILASPAYLDAQGRRSRQACAARLQSAGIAERVADLGAHGEPCRIAPAVWSSRGETLKQLALDGAGIVCRSDFMTAQGSRSGPPRADPRAPHARRAAADSCGLLPEHGDFVANRVIRRLSDRRARRRECRAKGGGVDASVTRAAGRAAHHAMSRASTSAIRRSSHARSAPFDIASGSEYARIR